MYKILSKSLFGMLLIVASSILNAQNDNGNYYAQPPVIIIPQQSEQQNAGNQQFQNNSRRNRSIQSSQVYPQGYVQQGFPPNGNFNNNQQISPNQPSAAPFPYPKSEFSEDGQLQGPFYFVDESPIQVLKILEVLTGKAILQPQNLPNVKINFTCKDKIFKDEAILALESLLSMNGIAIIPMGDNFLKAVSITGVNTQSPLLLSGDISKMDASQQFFSRIYRLEYLDIETIQPMLNSFISPNGIATLVLFARTNSFLLTDTLANHKRMEELLKNVDVKTEIREDMAFIRLKNTSAEEMKKRLANINSNILKKYFEKTIIDADERTNQLIVFTQKGNMEYIKSFVEGFDISAEPLTKSDVYYIKHGESKTVAKALSDIVKGQQQTTKVLQAKASKTRNTTISKSTKSTAVKAIEADSEDSPENAKKTNQADGDATTQQLTEVSESIDQSNPNLQFSDYVTIVADERSNSVIAYGTSSDLVQIKGLINKIDIPLLQVKIDVIITEVQLTNEEVSGLSSFNLGYDVTSPFSTTVAKGFSGGTGTNSLKGTQAFSIKATEGSFQAIFNVAKEKSNVKVLSAPTIVTSHNKSGRINISTSYPTIKSTISSVVNVDNTQSTIEYTDIGLTLTVTPFIGDNGLIQLELEQTANTILSQTTISGNEQPVIGKREAESFISVQNGDIIVMGGLQQNNLNDKDQSVWLLGDIPAIGELFKPTYNKYTKSELIIFIRPTIINSTSIANSLTDKQIKNSEATKMVERFVKEGTFTDSQENEQLKKFKSEKATESKEIESDSTTKKDAKMPRTNNPLKK